MQKIRTSNTHPIRVDFIRSEEFPILSRLGMTFAPGKKQHDARTCHWKRDLTDDVSRLRNKFRTDTLVSLVEDWELVDLGIVALPEESHRHGIEIIRFPITDVSIPSSSNDFCELIENVLGRLTDGKRVVVHCKGGLGRAGMTAACLAVAATDGEISGDDAILMVRKAREGTVEKPEQEQFVSSFGKTWSVWQQERIRVRQEQSPKPNVADGNYRAAVDAINKGLEFDPEDAADHHNNGALVL